LTGIHIINAFVSATRGSERAALNAARILREERPVRVWSVVPPLPEVQALAAGMGLAVETIRPFSGSFPRDGNLVLWGTHFEIGMWLSASRPLAVTIVCELFHHAALYRAVLDVRAAGLPEPRVVYVSTLLRDSALLAGEVIYPPTDIAPLLALERKPGRRLTIGRVSRDVAGKHHVEDPALYAALAQAGIAVRILGGTCLAAALSPAPLIELLPEGSMPVDEFLATLDIFFYRTAGAGHFVESSGLVVIEAMAAGLPVVAGPPGGFLDLVSDGVTGLVVMDSQAAQAALQRLVVDERLRLRLGETGRATVREYFGPGYGHHLLGHLFGQPAPA
jgi:glycosyltransferase involved in cell wall biosynthesis